MQSFNLKITTPNGEKFDGTCESVIVRTLQGDVAILARHTDYVTALSAGKCTVTVGGEKRTAACIGGVLSVIKGNATILASSFEWSDEIDLERAKEALENGKSRLAAAHDSKEVDLAKLRIMRALTRINVAEKK